MLERLRARLTGTTSRLASDEALAYLLLRVTIGVAMLVHGANRIAHGPEQFAAGMVTDFAGAAITITLKPTEMIVGSFIATFSRGDYASQGLSP